MAQVAITPEWNECFRWLSDPTVSEIEANGKNLFFIKKSGKRHQLKISLETEEDYIQGIQQSLIPFVKNFNTWDPQQGYIFEGPLQIRYNNTSIRGRTHIVLPPATNSPQITIAKKSVSLIDLDAIAGRGTMSLEMKTFLEHMIHGKRTIILSGGTGSGKSLSHNTIIPTPSGTTTMGEIQVGDEIFGSSGERGVVLKKFPQPSRPQYKMTLSTGEELFCDLEHNWWVCVNDSTIPKMYTTAEIIELLLKNNMVRIPAVQKAVEYREADTCETITGRQSLHPYLLGFLLSTSLAKNNYFINDHIAEKLNTVFTILGIDAEFSPVGIGRWSISGGDVPAQNLVGSYSVDEKFLRQYLFGSVDVRKMLASGIIDGMFCNNFDNVLEYKNFTIQKEIAELAKKLLCSLGFVAYVVEENYGYKVSWKSNSSVGVLNAQRRENSESGLLFRQITEIVETGENAEMSCITVDTSDSTYLVSESFIPTHNTTMLEALTKHIPLTTRIGVAEDTPELQLPQPNVSYLHSVPWAPGMDPNKVATLDWCVAQFNRMRTDLLIIGETRGKEFASFLTAANSGMEGCLTTIHANDPRGCLDKMTSFAIKGSEGVPIRSVNKDIAHAVDLIVQLAILPDGRHRMMSITEVTRTVSNDDSAQISTQELYTYDKTKDMFMKKNFPTDTLKEVLLNQGIDIVKVCPGSLLEPQLPHKKPDEVLTNIHNNTPNPSRRI